RGAPPLGGRGGTCARRRIGPGPCGPAAPGDLRRARAPPRSRRTPGALPPALTLALPAPACSVPDMEEVPSPLKEPGIDHSAESVRSTSHAGHSSASARAYDGGPSLRGPAPSATG